MSTASASTTTPPTAPEGAGPAVAPTFLVGSVRSGTTLLRLMLDHHPEIAFHFEFEFAVDQVDADGGFPPMDDYRKFLRQDRIFQLSGAEIDEQLGYQELVSSFLEQHRQRRGKRIVGATVHHGFDKLPHIWPDARYVHLSRDGRDVARSCRAMGWAGNMYCAADRWLEAENEWERMRETLPEDRRHEVKYEELIRQPEATLTALCRFLGCEFDEAIFDYADNSTYQTPDPSLLEQWRRKLSEPELQLAEARMGDMLLARGYELSGSPRIEIDAARAARLRWDDWWNRARFRQRRYGLGLFSADYLARKLGIAPWARRCKHRLDEIDNQHIR